MLRWRRPRRAMVSLWTLLMIPALLVLFAVVVEGVHLWLARVELENALEAAALAAVKEWAESTSGPAPGWTEGARIVGQTYAAANSINQTPVSIDTNLGTYSDTNPNENLSCEGNLVFGAITEEEPQFVFEADQVPSCLGTGGRVLVEVTSDNLTAGDNGWGLSFPTSDDPDFNSTVLIDRVEIDVNPDGTGNLRFDFTSQSPTLSANFPQPMVSGIDADGVVSEQHDNYGFIGWFNTTSPANPTFTSPDGAWPGGDSSPQIVFSPMTGTSTVLTITFHEYDDGITYDAGFSPGDRFRFGAPVRRGEAAADGDDIGKQGAKITVFFKDINGNPLPPEEGITGFFTDTEYGNRECGDRRQTPGIWEQDDLGNWHFLVHPIRFETPDETPLIARDLPCPLTAAASNDKQSIVMALGAPGVGNYAVRAQASHQVPSLICNFLGIHFGGPFTVSACTTAMYDCILRRPRLIRIEPENFYCPTRPVSP